MLGLPVLCLAAGLICPPPAPIDAAAAVRREPQPPATRSSEPGVQTPTLTLTLDDAIVRGLERNLLALRADAAVGVAAGRRWQALSALLPMATAEASAVRQKINLAAFGFSGPGFPEIIGPFNVFDGRLRVSQAVVDVAALDTARSEAARLTAARHDEEDARRLVALVVTTLYVNAVSAASRVDAGRAELESARTLARLAEDLKAAGLAPQIDVLRAQVQLELVEQRQIALENTLERNKLTLAQAIGLTPVTTALTLTDRLAYVAATPLTLEQGLAVAARDRADAQAAAARVQAAERELQARREDRVPTLHIHGDYGAIGNTVGLARPTFAAGAAVSVPIADAHTHGRIVEAEAELRRVRADHVSAYGAQSRTMLDEPNPRGASAQPASIDE